MDLTTQIAFNQKSITKNKAFLSELLTTIANVREKYPRGNSTDWKKVLVIMQERFPNRKMTEESLRNSYRRLTDVRVNQITKRKDDFVAGRVTFEQKLLNEIKQKRSMVYLCEKLDTNEDKVFETVAKLQFKGYRGVAIYDDEGVVYVHNRIRFYKTIPGMSGDHEGLNLSEIYGGDIIRFAVVSDTHIGHKCADIKSLHKFYDYIHSEGIDTVLHVGDLTDGYYTQRPTSVLEQDAVGYGNQLRLFVDKYPYREGVTTYGITGNHDYTHMRNGLANIGDGISDKRDDFVYLGHNFGKVTLAKGLTVSLIHPTDGASAALSSKIRDLIDRNPHRRSNIMLVGHYHKTAHEKYQGVYGYMVPSFERKTEFMDDNNLTSDVGGMIFTVQMGRKNEILSVTTEYVDYS